MAISAEHPNVIPSFRTTQPAQSPRLQKLIDHGTVYVAQNLNPSQLATLQAVAPLLLESDSKHLATHLDAALQPTTRNTLPAAPPDPCTFDYQLGLDELDTLSRTRTGYAFADLTPEIQDAILDLIASRALTTRKLDLALWLHDLHANAANAI